jgi:hypothetical protein
MHRDGVMPALRTWRGTMPAELLLGALLFFVGSLNLLENGRQRGRLHAGGGGFRPSAPPSADSATKRFVHDGSLLRVRTGPRKLRLGRSCIQPVRHPRTWTRMVFVLPLTPIGAPKTMTTRSPGEPKPAASKSPVHQSTS